MVERLFRGNLGPGRHALPWAGGGSGQAAGIYFIRLRAGNDEAIQKVVRVP
jgi:hypothetical protein